MSDSKALLRNSKKALFPLGTVCMTPGVAELVEQHQLSIHEYLARHVSGDWGDVCIDDAAENTLSLLEGYRILSAYTFTSAPAVHSKIWIITEANRSVTTLLLPSEY